MLFCLHQIEAYLKTVITGIYKKKIIIIISAWLRKQASNARNRFQWKGGQWGWQTNCWVQSRGQDGRPRHKTGEPLNVLLHCCSPLEFALHSPVCSPDVHNWCDPPVSVQLWLLVLAATTPTTPVFVIFNQEVYLLFRTGETWKVNFLSSCNLTQGCSLFLEFWREIPAINDLHWW